MPMPKSMKFNILEIKSRLERARLFVKKAAIIPGLQGRTIAPKKKPNRNAWGRGFFVSGTRTLGNILPKSR